jgi:translation initiation factor IF-3
VLRFREVRLIGAEGEQHGVVPSREALAIAKASDLDLVMVAPTAQPPVCRVLDYGKYKYETEKREKDSKKKQQEVKGIMLRPNTAEHDRGTLIRKASGFLKEGDKVRVVCRFKQREVAHPELGHKQMRLVAEALAEVATVEKVPDLVGRQMVMVLIPKPTGKAAKPEGKDQNAENQDKQDGSEAV